MAPRFLESRAFGSPGRYVQGPGEFDRLPDYVRPFGQKIFVLIDPFLFEQTSNRLTQLFGKSTLSFRAERFGGECSEAEVARIISLGCDYGPDIMAGFGGGKTLDTAKYAAEKLGLPIFIIPSSASTDAPTSSMSIIYSDKGEHVKAVCHHRSPDLVLVDSQIIAKAPLRLFVAGMGDGLSTWFEARANQLSDTPNYIGQGYRRCQAALAIAERCQKVILSDGLVARRDLERGIVTEAVENVIEANILLSGLGFENAGCAGAHSLHTGFHEFPISHQYYHGEIVSFGIVFQLVMEKSPKEEKIMIAEFLKKVGLPVTLKQLGLEASRDNVMTLTRRVMDGNSGVEAEPFPITRELVYNSILEADAFGTSILAGNQVPT